MSVFEVTTADGSRQVSFLMVMSIFVTASYVTVILRSVRFSLGSKALLIKNHRLYCRHFYLRNVGFDDYIMVGALVSVTGMAIMNSFHVALGTGRHTYDLPLLEILIPTLKHWYAFQLVYPFTLWLVKASILALYLRIMTQEKFKKAVYVMGGFITVQSVVVIFVQVRVQVSRGADKS